MRNETYIRRALELANLNALRMALYECTRDPDLLTMRTVLKPLWSGTWNLCDVAPEHHAMLKEKALAFLCSGQPRSPVEHSEHEIRALMENCVGQALGDSKFRFGLEELAFRESSRAAQWGKNPPPSVRNEFFVAVIGAGIGGIAAAIQLQRLGIPFRVFDRQSDVGGTWCLNTYPEARVDVASHHYSYSFETNYPWKHYFATQPELLEYLKHCVRKYEIGTRIELNTTVLGAEWEQNRGCWSVKIRKNGQATEQVDAHAVISAAGLFNKPHLPDIPGIETFGGRMFHTTAWDHAYDLAGKRIGLIGNGSTGAQVMPHLARHAQKLTVFQRTPGWITGVDGYHSAVPGEAQWLYDNMPHYWNWDRFTIFDAYFNTDGLHTFDREWQRAGGRISKRNDGLRSFATQYIVEKLSDRPDLLSKSIPSYAPWSRRPIVDNGWYDALKCPNVELVTGGIECIQRDGIRGKGGVEHSLDLIVLSSGFEVSQYLWPARYTGRDGITLQDAWKKDGPRAYLGMVVPGFPNLFMFYGPNAQPRSGALFIWLEIWARYAVQAIASMIESGANSMECRPEVFERYNARMDAELKDFIWETEGAGSYYVNEFGRSGPNMPFHATDYFKWVSTPDLDDYITR
jgi:4-hydroxyacetophenone monooxygenase